MTRVQEKLRPEKRRKFKAYDGLNNIFNLVHEVLQWKVHRAVINKIPVKLLLATHKTRRAREI